MAGSEYNFSSRFLHRLALQSRMMAEISFDAENALVGKKTGSSSDNPVFISGLARAGTTILMRYLYESGEFRSLTYQDMPFVLMPNLWKKFSARREAGEYKERAHKDGIMVSFESPEAFEEVFWRVFTGAEYIKKDRLKLQKVSSEVLGKFRDYIHNVIVSADNPSQTRYLSKNNNNILRLPYLFKAFPNARIVIPFRDPLQHAVSLLSQHIHFSKIQSKDKFSLDYMNWLGHFEFGLNQKPFYFSDNDTFMKLDKSDKMKLDFWLHSWKNYYEFALNNVGDNTILFSYSELCKSPSTVLSKLFKELNVSHTPVDLKPFNPPEKEISGYSETLLKECMDIYKNLELTFNSWYLKG